MNGSVDPRGGAYSRSRERFSLAGLVGVITGGAGLLGRQHAEALVQHGATVVIADIDGARAQSAARDLSARVGRDVDSIALDVREPDSVAKAHGELLQRHGTVDILVNNAANNPKVESAEQRFTRFENFSLQQWHDDIAVGLTGAFVSSQVFGTGMASRGRGVIINISSEYGIIAPDQRLYLIDGLPETQQPAKPVSYTVVKAGLHGLTLYLSAYWAQKGVRVNTITVGGVENGQPPEFLARAADRIPMSRMAKADEFQGALVFLCSDASSFVTGANIVVDGGKSVW